MTKNRKEHKTCEDCRFYYYKVKYGVVKAYCSKFACRIVNRDSNCVWIELRAFVDTLVKADKDNHSSGKRL